MFDCLGYTIISSPTWIPVFDHGLLPLISKTTVITSCFPPCRQDSKGDRHESIPRHPSPGRWPRRLRCRKAPATQWTAIIFGMKCVWNVLKGLVEVQVGSVCWSVPPAERLQSCRNRTWVINIKHPDLIVIFHQPSDMMDDGFSPSHPCQPLRVPELRQRDSREDFASVLGKSTDPKIWCPNPGAPLFPTCQVRVL